MNNIPRPCNPLTNSAQQPHIHPNIPSLWTCQLNSKSISVSTWENLPAHTTTLKPNQASQTNWEVVNHLETTCKQSQGTKHKDGSVESIEDKCVDSTSAYPTWACDIHELTKSIDEPFVQSQWNIWTGSTADPLISSSIGEDHVQIDAQWVS